MDLGQLREDSDEVSHHERFQNEQGIRLMNVKSSAAFVLQKNFTFACCLTF